MGTAYEMLTSTRQWIYVWSTWVRKALTKFTSVCRWAQSFMACVALSGAMLCFAGNVSATSAPSNDKFDNAQTLSGTLPIEASGTNVGATLQTGEPGQGLSSGGHTIWFRWEAPTTEAVTVSTCGSEIRTNLGVHIGNAVGALAEVASNTWPPDCGFEEGSQATFRAVSGRIYSIQVDGSTYHESFEPPVSGEGAIKLQIRHRDAPANDDFVNAEPVELNSLAVPAPNFGATKEPGEPDHRGNKGGASVWFKFTAPRTGGVSVQLSGGPMDRENLVAAYTGSSVDDLVPVPAIESWTNSRIVFPTTAGMTYSIAVDGSYDPETETPLMDEPEIILSTFPGNDDFEDAFKLSSMPVGGTFGVFGLGNVGATKQIGEPDHAGNRGGSSVWFTWTSAAVGSAQLSACGATFDTLLAVYTGSTLGGLTPVAASQSPTSAPCSLVGPDPAEVSFNVESGTTYRIAVDGYEGAWGSFGLELHTSSERLPEISQPAVEPRPNTKIARRNMSRRGRAVFHLSATVPGSRFLCRLDSPRFKKCGSKVVYEKLKPGWHTFAAKAVSPSGQVDSSPVVFHFRVAR